MCRCRVVWGMLCHSELSLFKRKCEMKAKVSWVEGMKFLGESESGHQVTLDGANPGEGASPI